MRLDLISKTIFFVSSCPRARPFASNHLETLVWFWLLFYVSPLQEFIVQFGSYKRKRFGAAHTV